MSLSEFKGQDFLCDWRELNKERNECDETGVYVLRQCKEQHVFYLCEVHLHEVSKAILARKRLSTA